MMQKYDAFIAAGGQAPWLKEISGTDCRCLALINKKRIIDYIIKALNDSGRINRIVVAASENAIPHLIGTLADNVIICKAESTLPATAIASAKQLGNGSNKILGVCDDIPLLTADGVRNFLEQCEKNPQMQLYYPIIPQKACLEQFPHAKRTYGKLADGIFTGGNMMLMAQEIMPKGQEKALELFKMRKSPLKLANWLGWSFIFKLLCCSLTIEQVQKRFSQLMEIRSQAIITTYAGIGMDIDKPEDWYLAEKYLQEKTKLL